MKSLFNYIISIRADYLFYLSVVFWAFWAYTDDAILGLIFAILKPTFVLAFFARWLHDMYVHFYLAFIEETKK